MKTATRPTSDDASEASVQRIVPARGIRPPATTAPNSVFQAGTKAGAEARKGRPRVDLTGFDVSTIAIRKGVPKPPALQQAKALYLDLAARMAVGDSVVLDMPIAKAFYNAAGTHGKTLAPPQAWSLRKLDSTSGAVWRDA